MSTDIARLDSISDARESGIHTDVSDVVADLALLANGMSVPRIMSPLKLARELDPEELWMCRMVRVGMCVQGILDLSPLDEDETLRILARLVGLRVVTLAQGAAQKSPPSGPAVGIG